MKKTKPDSHTNRNILLITYLMVGLFISMIGYFGSFFRSDYPGRAAES